MLMIQEVNYQLKVEVPQVPTKPEVILNYMEVWEQVQVQEEVLFFIHIVEDYLEHQPALRLKELL